MSQPSSSTNLNPIAVSKFKGIYLFLCGVCMGAADLVPGISGGTIAFIMGFYHDLLESLKSFKWNSFRLLLSFKFKAFSKAVAWPFLLTLVGGIAFSFLTLATLLRWVLEHEIYRVYLYSGFFGLIIASFVLCMKELKRWTFQAACGLMIGLVSAYSLTTTTLSKNEIGSYAIKIEHPTRLAVNNYDQEKGLLTQLTEDDLSILLAKNEISLETPIYNSEGVYQGEVSQVTYKYKSSLINGWLIFCGAVAVCALLLPGISGSYLLTLLGVYPQAISALADLIANLKQGQIDGEAAVILMNLLLGIILGALSFSRFASWLLRKYPDMSLAVLSGFMIGALRSVWPFWSYSYALMPLKLHKGPQLIAVEPIWPELLTGSFALAITSSFVGFAVVMSIDRLASQKKNRLAN